MKNKKIEEKNSNLLTKTTDFKVYELLLFSFLIVICTIIISLFIFNSVNNNKNNSSVIKKSNSKLSEFENVYNLIKNSYYKDVDDNTLIDGAINGMLNSLNDPHTSYFNKEETESFNELMEGSYKGIGAEVVKTEDGKIMILSVFKNSPASDAGLKYGDYIVSVDGKKTDGMSTSEVVAIIKNKNTTVTSIIISRDNVEKEYKIEKRVVIIESVENKIYKRNSKKIGYILVNNFADNTYEQFKKAVEEMEKENISGLIIDVRDNSGGYLHAVTSMLNMLIPKGKIIYQIADKKNTQKYTSSTMESRNYPIAVLTNKSSASASEILAIALKESYEAEVIGTTTYGKGTVQTTDTLINGAMIKYTIQKWLSPNGNWINEKGVEPTINVELSSEYINNPTEENDNQLQKALEVISK